MRWQSLLRPWNRSAPGPRLTAIFVSPSAGAPMQSLSAADAVPGEGLVGDRYYAGSGHWHPVESCQVTLLSADDLERARRRLPVALNHGEHRRNLVISGLRTKALEGRRFRIGTVRFEYWKPRPPCGYINQVTGENMARALGRNSGVCLLVLEGGRLEVGDAVMLEPPETG